MKIQWKKRVGLRIVRRAGTVRDVVGNYLETADNALDSV